MKSKMKKILAILLMVCLVVPSIPARIAGATEGETEKSIDEFVTVANKTSAVNFGDNLYNDKKINSTMAGGALFVFHMKVKLPLDESTGNTDITYTGWQNKDETLFLEFRYDKNTEDWYFQVESQIVDGAARWNLYKANFSDEQCNKIKNEGLDLYLAKTEAGKYDIYMENSDLNSVELVYQWTSAVTSPQMYKVDNKKSTVVTTGYFYEGYTAEEVVNYLWNARVIPTVDNISNLTVTGLKESYTLGETAEFTISHQAGHVDTVTVAGETVTPNAEGKYQFLVKKEHIDNCNIVISTLAPTFTFLEDTNGERIQLVGSGTNNFGNKGDNFLFHTKIQCHKLVNQQEEIQYPTSETMYASIQYGGWASNTYPWISYNIQFVLDATSAKLKFVGDDNWNTTPITLDEAQIRKIANDGLDIYFVHSSSAAKVFEMYVEQGESDEIYASNIQLTSNTSGNTTVYQVKQNEHQDETTIVTTGYAYTDYATTKTAAELFAELTAKDLAIKVTTDEHLLAEGLDSVCHIGDYLSFTTTAEEGYVVQEVKINNVVVNPQEDGTYKHCITIADLDGIQIEVNGCEKTIDEFVAVTNKTSAVNFGDNLYNDKKINSTMAGGALFVFHMKVKLPLDESTGNTDITYTGWQNKDETLFLEFRYDKNTEDWYFQVESQIVDGAARWGLYKETLSDEQCNKIKNEGLDLYLVKTEAGKYDIYMENSVLSSVELVYQWTSAVTSPQMYKVDNKKSTVVTIGYFYQGYTANEIVNYLWNARVNPTVDNTDNLTVTGLKESYTLGETAEFSVSHTAGHVDTVTVAGETLTPNSEGMYQFIVKMEHIDNCNVVISTFAPTFEFLEHSNGGKIQLIGSGNTGNFGANTGNFLFHTKLKCESIVNAQGQIQYPESETIYAQIKYSGWSSSPNTWVGYFIKLVLDSETAKLTFAGGSDIDTTPVNLDEAQIRKIANDGLDIFFVHSADNATVFDMYVEQGETENLVDTKKNVTINNNTQAYEVAHEKLYEGTTIVTTGYSYTDYTTTKTAAEVFSELTAKDISIQITTNEYASLEVANGVCHIGDYLTFAPATEEEYAVSSVTVNGTKLTPASNGVYHYAVTLEHLDGLSIEVVAGQAFEEFVTLTGTATNQHGDKLDKFIYHTKVQGDLSQTGEQYINITYYTWGDNVGDSVCVRINISDSGTATLLLGKYYSGSDGGWGQTTHTLDAKQVKKIKGSGLNFYLVHEGTASKTFDLYVEDVNSESVTKVCTLDAYHGDHVYKVSQAKKDGVSVTTIGYQYADFLSSTTAPTELFWVEQNVNTGDVNDDGKVSVADIIRAKKYANNTTVDSMNVRAGDMNQSRTLAEDDMNGLRYKVLQNIVEGVQLDYYDSLSVQTNSTNPALNSSLFYNNVRTTSTIYGADPAVMEITKSGDKNQGKYIMVVTGNSTNQSIPVYIGTDLANWKSTGTITIVNENGESAADVATSDLWAMEMIYDEIEDKYYLFFSATPTTVNSAIKEVPYVAVGDSYTGNFKLINHSDYKYADNTALTSKDGTDALGYASYLKYSVFDPYEMGQALKNVGLVSNPTATPFQAIDLHPFVDVNGDKYLYFSITSISNKQVILGIKMTDWSTPQYDTLTVLTEVQKDQVSNGSTVAYERSYTNEGPWMTVHNGTYYLTFSTNSYEADNYKVIQAVANDPLGAFRKLTVEEGGILLGADRIGEVSGPGHHSLIEKNGEYYIVYHVHDDPTDPSYQRHIAMNKVEWVTNENGLEVMYVNGPTLASVQPLPEFASGYKNIAPSANITATNVKDGNSISWLKDKIWNSKGSTWKSSGLGTGTFFGDTCAKDVEFSSESTITMSFEAAKAVRGLMIYNSSSTDNAFDEIERIEFVCSDGSVKYINHLGFDFTANTYTLADYQGDKDIQNDPKFICGASVAEFNEMSVTEIRITIKPADGKSSVALGEIVVLGKN